MNQLPNSGKEASLAADPRFRQWRRCQLFRLHCGRRRGQRAAVSFYVLLHTFKKIIARAGVEGWVKPFQNLRASRQTELEQTYPTYVVCRWLGNTPSVARKHYLTVTEDHYRTAAAWGQTGDKRGTQTPVETRVDAHEKSREPHKLRENATFSDVVDILENARMAGTGFEPATSRL